MEREAKDDAVTCDVFGYIAQLLKKLFGSIVVSGYTFLVAYHTT